MTTADYEAANILNTLQNGGPVETQKSADVNLEQSDHLTLHFDDYFYLGIQQGHSLASANITLDLQSRRNPPSSTSRTRS